MATIINKLDEYEKKVLVDLLASSIHGNCYNFAIAMHRGLGWPIIGLIDKNIIIHAGVRLADKMVWDGRGQISEDEFSRPFVDPPFYIRELTEDELIVTGQVNEHMVGFYMNKAQVFWPELPWKKGATQRERVIAFVDELEALSRKHKLWISGNMPVNMPFIFNGLDDESGYAIKPTIDGNTYMIRRIIG